MPRHWNLPLSYQPKIPAVRSGACRQTIRLGNKKKVGDYVRFFTWAGRPYHSRWVWVLEEYQELTMVKNVTIIPKGIIMTVWNDEFPVNPLTPGSYGCAKLWCWTELDWLAALDFISPPTGIELGKVLMGKNKIPDEGVEAQILRWG